MNALLEAVATTASELIQLLTDQLERAGDGVFRYVVGCARDLGRR